MTQQFTLNPILKRTALALSLLALPALSHAHLLGHQAGGFASGLQHPISGLDHIVAMIAVGLWAAQLGKRALWVLPLTFPVVMVLGGALGFAGVSLPGIEIGIALSAVVLGILVLARKQAPLWIAALLVGVFAIFHGHAHGTELVAGQSGLTYAIGFVAMTALLHLAGIGLGLLSRGVKLPRLEQAAGAAVAVTGVYFLGMATI